MKEKILHKAADMFLNLGVKSVTMDEIATELGISKKTLYASYSTKTDLIKSTALFVFERISAGIHQIQEDKKDPIEEMYDIKNFACEHLRDEKTSPQYQLKKYYPNIYKMVQEKQKQLMLDQMQDNLVRGIELGIYRSELPVPFINRMYFLGILGIRDPDLFPSPEFQIRELNEKHLEYHLRAIVTEKGLKVLEQLLKTNN